MTFLWSHDQPTPLPQVKYTFELYVRSIIYDVRMRMLEYSTRPKAWLSIWNLITRYSISPSPILGMSAMSIYSVSSIDVHTGALIECESIESQIHNIKCIIDTLSEDLLKVDLSHISAAEVANGDVMSIYNLIEILDGMLDYLLEKGTSESDSGGECTWITYDLNSSSSQLYSMHLRQELPAWGRWAFFSGAIEKFEQIYHLQLYSDITIEINFEIEQKY